MYIIHQCEFNKFKVKRDRILEKFFLFKTFAYSSFEVMHNYQNLFFKFSTIYEKSIQIL